MYTVALCSHNIYPTEKDRKIERQKRRKKKREEGRGSYNEEHMMIE